MVYILAILLASLCAADVQAEVRTEAVEYRQGDAVLEGYLAYDDSIKGARPGVVVVHEWWGLNDYIKGRARELAGLGYVAFAIDMYGKGVRPSDAKAASAQAHLYRSDRALMRERAKAGLEALLTSPLVDRKKVAAMGYCFGGGVALELARSGAELKGAVSFHGMLDTPHPEDAKNIQGKVLVLQGADDQYVKPQDVLAFEDEMRAASVDWQVNIYGGAVHGFTNPANGSDPSKGVAYDREAALRSWEAMKLFFAEIFR